MKPATAFPPEASTAINFQRASSLSVPLASLVSPPTRLLYLWSPLFIHLIRSGILCVLIILPLFLRDSLDARLVVPGTA